MPPDALFLSRWEVARVAVYPSTVGLTVLTGVALLFDNRLAALIAGLLTGAGVAALAIGLYSVWWAHTRGLSVFVERGRAGRVFAKRRDR